MSKPILPLAFHGKQPAFGPCTRWQRARYASFAFTGRTMPGLACRGIERFRLDLNQHLLCSTC